MSAPFPLPVVFESWGFRNPADKWKTPDELADYCAAAGAKTVAVQLGQDYSSDTPNCTADEAARLRERGLRVVVWGIATWQSVQANLDRLGCSHADWLPQIEGPDQRDLVYEAARYGVKAQAIVTTYSGASDPADVERLHGLGVLCALVECYAEAGYPHTDLNLMLWQGTQYGWKPEELFACMGTYRGELPDAYQRTDVVGRDFALYLAEPMSSEQFYAYGALNAGTPKPEPPTPEEDDVEHVTDQQGRDGVMFAVQAASQNWTSDKPKGRLTIARRVCQAANDDPKWNSCRDTIVKALDDAGVPA